MRGSSRSKLEPASQGELDVLVSYIAGLVVAVVVIGLAVVGLLCWAFTR